MLSQASGGSPFQQVPMLIDGTGNSLHSKMNDSFVSHAMTHSIPERFGGSAGTLGIQGSSGNFYLDSLVDPSRPAVRIPDLYSKRTAVHKSFFYGTLTPNTSTATQVDSLGGSAFWSIIVNPFIGLESTTNWNDATVSTMVGDGAAAWTITRSVDPDIGVLSPIINEIRPVSAYLYVSFVGDTLNDGGQTAATLMPSGSVISEVPSWTDVQSRFLPNVNLLSLQPGAYLGPASKGCMVRWAPEDERDSFFYSVAQANAYQYPTLVASGVTTQSKPNIRYIVEVNYELTTQSRLLSQIPSPIKLKYIEHAKASLQGVPYACANDDHVSLWSRFLTWARGAAHTVEDFWNNDVKPIFAPVAKGVGAALTAVGVPEFGVPLSAMGQYASS
jgi:hypothetical protein